MVKIYQHSTFDLIALSNALTGPFPVPSQTISFPSTKICAFAVELILFFESLSKIISELLISSLLIIFIYGLLSNLRFNF